MTTTTATAAQVDAELAAIYADEAKVQARRDGMGQNRSADCEYCERYRRACGRPHYTEAQAPELARLDAKLAELAAAAAPGEAAYVKAGRWARFFLVMNTGGHIHSTTHCHTCQPTTRFAWLTELSGTTAADAVAAYGEALCSVCFPDAPVAWTTGELRSTVQEREARAAEKAERDAAKAVKAIANPDGTPLRGLHGVIATERTAQVELVDLIGCHRAYGYGAHEDVQERIVAALAAKRGQSAAEVMATVETKVAAWLKRNAR